MHVRALYEDSCLYIVPGSHKVPRTPEQRAHSSTLDPPKTPLDMPGAMRVIIKRKSLYDNFVGHTFMLDISRRDGVLQLEHTALRNIRLVRPTRDVARIDGISTWRIEPRA